MQNIGGFGLQIGLRASVTFPIGLTITAFADDADAFDAQNLVVAAVASGLNGDLVVWSKAAPLEVTFNLIPNSDDDISMSVLLEANRVGKGKRSANDVITLVVNEPDGGIITYTGGRLISGLPANSVASSARMKSKPYAFAFENKVG